MHDHANQPDHPDADNHDAHLFGDAADHVSEARTRARQVLGGEAHLGAIDDWRQSLVSARDALLLTFLAWQALSNVAGETTVGPLLLAFVFGVALVISLSKARATATQVDYYMTEFLRERREIKEDFEHECSEIRALYAAKGFREPLLSQVVSVLSADNDRLLKVMMEEELGLSMQHMQHPLLVGVWNFLGAALAGMLMTLPLFFVPADQAGAWMVGGGLVWLALLSVSGALLAGRSATAMFASSLLIAVVAGGTVHYLTKWLAGQYGAGG